MTRTSPLKGAKAADRRIGIGSDDSRFDPWFHTKAADRPGSDSHPGPPRKRT